MHCKLQHSYKNKSAHVTNMMKLKVTRDLEKVNSAFVFFDYPLQNLPADDKIRNKYLVVGKSKEPEEQGSEGTWIMYLVN